MLTAATVKIDGCFTRELSVPGDGPVFLLLHGFSDSADCWRPVIKRLHAAGARGVAVDLPGFGLADSPPFDGDMFGVYDRFVDAAVTRYADSLPNSPIRGRSDIRGFFTTPPPPKILVIIPIIWVVRREREGAPTG